MSLKLSQLAELKLVDRQWRRVARRVLTSDEWLLMGGCRDSICLEDGNAILDPIPRSAQNLACMRRAIEYQWTTLQLPCRVSVLNENFTRNGDAKLRDVYGTLEDLTVDENRKILSITLSLAGHRFFSPHEIDAHFTEDTNQDTVLFGRNLVVQDCMRWKQYEEDDDDDLSETILYSL